jgi:hypothetical protein
MLLSDDELSIGIFPSSKNFFNPVSLLSEYCTALLIALPDGNEYWISLSHAK